MVLIYVLIAFLAGVIVWKGSGILEESTETLALYYQLPVVVQGAVLAAVASSFPELTSVVIATSVHGTFSLGVGAIGGSAIFNITMIPGLSAILAGRSGIHSSKQIVNSDILYYALSIAVLVIMFTFGLIYFPVESQELVGTVNRPLALMGIATYVVYLFMKQQDTMEIQKRNKTTHRAIPELNTIKEWFTFAGGIVLVVVSVESLVWSGIHLSQIIGIPDFIWGMVVLAAITSLPDAIISIDAARAGNGDLSLSNVVGSNIFDLLICLPVGILIAGTATVDLTEVIPMMGILVLATILLFFCSRTGLRLTRTEGMILVGSYCLFVVLVIGEILGATHFIRQ
jgi:cation:H+ antiporter